MKSFLETKKFFYVNLCTFLLLFPSILMAIEEPKYVPILSDKPFEVRKYEGFTVAETELTGSFDSASRKGFRRVANYIFGGNENEEGNSEKIQMTAPVTVTPKNDGWSLHFVMPSSYSLKDLPLPIDNKVVLKSYKEHLAGVVVFNGWTTESRINDFSNKLTSWLNKKNYEIIGPQQVARYNDPFTLPWLRRNEIIFMVKKK